MKFQRFSIIIFTTLIVILLTSCTKKVNNELDYELKIEEQDDWTSIGGEIFVSSGEHDEVNMVLVKSGNEAAVIDTGYDKKEGLRVKEYIDKNNLVLKYLIFTHMDEDQKNNLSMFRGDGVNLITSFNTQDNQIIELGDKKLKILHTPGHSDDMHISIEIGDKILVAGDILTTNTNTQTCITYDQFISLKDILGKLKENDYKLIIPAHGNILKDSLIITQALEDIEEQLSKHKVNKRNSKWMEIDEDIIVVTSNYLVTNLVLVKSGSEVTIIDTGKDIEDAAAFKEYIENNNLTLKNLILTHRHYDHDSNLDMFMNDNVNFYEYTNSQDNQVIEMGDKTMKILFTSGHDGENHLSVEINDNILVAGDIVLSSISVIRALGDRDTLIKTLEKIKEKEYTLIIPGHGDICIGNSIIDEHILTLKRYKN